MLAAIGSLTQDRALFDQVQPFVWFVHVEVHRNCFVHMSMYIYVHVCECLCVCVCVCVCACVCVCVCVCVAFHIHTYIYRVFLNQGKLFRN